MAKVGLLSIARIVLPDCHMVRPGYRSHFSNPRFTQPKLPTVLCLMRSEDYTFREAEVRLGEPLKLCLTFGPVTVPDFITLQRFPQRQIAQTINRTRDDAQVVQNAEKRSHANPRSGERDPLGASSGEHLLYVPHASSRAKSATVAALAEVAGRGRPRSKICFIAIHATRSLERLCELANSYRSGC